MTNKVQYVTINMSPNYGHKGELKMDKYKLILKYQTQLDKATEEYKTYSDIYSSIYMDIDTSYEDKLNVLSCMKQYKSMIDILSDVIKDLTGL